MFYFKKLAPAFFEGALVAPARKVSMLHPCMNSKFLINIENTESTHGEIL